ncbi:hypothetical protein [Salmonella phage SD-15_S21]|nr:hypothetical protein [Salmonella phage SD-15_S21]
MQVLFLISYIVGNYSPPDVKHYTLLNLVCKYFIKLICKFCHCQPIPGNEAYYPMHLALNLNRAIPQ